MAKLDRIDRKILNILQEDCTMAVSEISAKVALSSTPCWRRIQRMEKEGIISKRVALLDPKKINAEVLLDNGKALNISQLTSLIKDSSFIIANDTGPAHIAAHVGAKGLTLFGKHTTAYKVSIERDNFKAIEVTDLNNLSAEKVFERLVNSLN